MAKLILTTDKSNNHSEPQIFPIEQDIITIGRTEDNDIFIDSMAVSSKHAKIVTIINDAFLEDMGSTNGTFVNAEKVSKYALLDGDLITIGTHSLKYVRDDESDDDETLSPSSKNQQIAESTLAHLIIKEGEGEGKDIPISKKMTTLGKPGVHVAAITQRSDGFHFVHVDGGDDEHASILNGKPVTDKGALLKDNDIIEVAGVKMAFTSCPQE